MSMTQLFHGERVLLTSFAPEDAAAMARWYEDGEFSRLWDTSAAYPRSVSRLSRYFEGFNGGDSFGFAIRLREGERFIGAVDLSDIQWTHRVGWLAIAIGDPAQRGKGYGYEALELMLRFAFHELNLFRVQLTVFSYNARAIRLYERLGFTHEGTYRQYLERDGKRHDMLLYGLLRPEWEALIR